MIRDAETSDDEDLTEEVVPWTHRSPGVLAALGDVPRDQREGIPPEPPVPDPPPTPPP